MSKEKKLFAGIGKKTIVKKNHKDIEKEKVKAEKPTQKPKPSKPFKEGNDGFVRSTISIPNDFGKFLHEQVLYGGIKKKKMTEIIMNLLEEKYEKDFMEWKNE